MEYRPVRRENDDEGFPNKYQYGLALKGRAKWRRMAERFPKEVQGIVGGVFGARKHYAEFLGCPDARRIVQ